MEVKDFFNLYWKERHLRWFDRYYNFLTLINRDIFCKILEFEKKRILVIGIGDSKDIDFFSKLKGKVISIDISIDVLKECRSFDSIQMDAGKMGFKKESFDIVFLRTVMLHLDHREVLHEIERVMRDGGRFFWVEPMKNNIFLWLFRFVVSPGKLTKVDYLTYREILSYEHLFKNCWHKEYYFITVILIPLYVLFPLTRRFIHLLQRLEMRIIDRLRWLRRFCWISYGYGEL